MSERSVEDFLFGPVIDHTESEPEAPVPAPDPVRAAIEREGARQRQMTIEGGDEAVGAEPDLQAKARKHLAAMVFGSAHEGEPHIVTRQHLVDGDAVMCTCPAALSIAKRPRGCWAMTYARTVWGIPAIP